MHRDLLVLDALFTANPLEELCGMCHGFFGMDVCAHGLTGEHIHKEIQIIVLPSNGTQQIRDVSSVRQI